MRAPQITGTSHPNKAMRIIAETRPRATGAGIQRGKSMPRPEKMVVVNAFQNSNTATIIQIPPISISPYASLIIISHAALPPIVSSSRRGPALSSGFGEGRGSHFRTSPASPEDICRPAPFSATSCITNDFTRTAPARGSSPPARHPAHWPPRWFRRADGRRGP